MVVGNWELVFGKHRTIFYCKITKYFLISYYLLLMLILASSSPRRQQLLSYLVSDFKILTADLDEDSFVPLARSPQELVTKLSLAKAKKVIETHKLQNETILASDTVVVFSSDNQFIILGKPKDLQEAKKTLLQLRGTTHQVYTGFTFIDQKSNQTISDYDVSHITLKNFSDQLLNEYVTKFQPLDKAGSYAVQELDNRYIEKLEGSYSNIVGLPLEKIAPILTKLDFPINSNWQDRISHDFPFSK